MKETTWRQHHTELWYSIGAEIDGDNYKRHAINKTDSITLKNYFKCCKTAKITRFEWCE